MIKTKKVTETFGVPEFITCDKCGEEYEYDTTDVFEIQEFLKIDFYGGYGSVFGDGSRVRCDICQRCLFEMIAPYMKVSKVNG